MRFTLFIILIISSVVFAEIKPALFKEGRYSNESEVELFNFGKGMGMLGKMLFDDSPWQQPDSMLPVQNFESHALMEETQGIHFRKLGHSTVLFKLGDVFIITDPIFSDRCSPVSFAGPKRFSPNPISPEELPPMDWILISHNHYDHLDQSSIEILDQYKPKYVVPMGVKDLLVDWGVAKDSIYEVNWGDSIQTPAFELHSVPSQHFSGRGLMDRMESLWTAYLIRWKGKNIYFSGDTAYNTGFKKAHKKFGSMDLAFLEVGAYNVQWNNVHMLPTEAVLAAKDLEAKWVVPVHSGTFDLAFHPWFEPMEQFQHYATQAGFQVLQPAFGEGVSEPFKVSEDFWWKSQLPPEYKFEPKVWENPIQVNH